MLPVADNEGVRHDVLELADHSEYSRDGCWLAARLYNSPEGAQWTTPSTMKAQRVLHLDVSATLKQEWPGGPPPEQLNWFRCIGSMPAAWSA